MDIDIYNRIKKEYGRVTGLGLDRPGVEFVYFALCEARFQIGKIAKEFGVSTNTLYRWGYGDTEPNSVQVIKKLSTHIEAIKWGIATKRLPSHTETLNSILIAYVNECAPVSQTASA